MAQQSIPRFSLVGVSGAETSHHPFTTEDGLSLSLTRFRRAQCADPVLLVHGLTSASDIFIMPEHRNLTSYLLDHGFSDVWALDSRMSNRFPYNTEPGPHSLDDLARFDYPAALAELRRHTGLRPVHVIAHCLGSVAFSMSLAGGAVDGIRSLVANSVALTPRLTTWPRWKLQYGPELLEHALGLSVLDPHASASSISRCGAVVVARISASNADRSTVCRRAAGFPASARARARSWEISASRRSVPRAAREAMSGQHVVHGAGQVADLVVGAGLGDALGQLGGGDRRVEGRASLGRRPSGPHRLSGRSPPARFSAGRSSTTASTSCQSGDLAPRERCGSAQCSSCSCVVGSVRVRPVSSRSIIWRAW